MITRRTLFRGTAGTLAGAMLTRPVYAASPLNTAVTEFQELPSAQDERLKMLVTTAVDAARSAGAQYSDARLTFTQQMKGRGGNIGTGREDWMFDRQEDMAFGVRAQCDGYWGFAASPVWTKDEAARLGRMAVDSAKANLFAKPRAIEMALNPHATSGDWSMPVTEDPFTMDPDEIYDYLSGLYTYALGLPRDYRLSDVSGFSVFLAKFFRQQKAFGSTDGQFQTQRVYRTGGWFEMFAADASGLRAAGDIRQFNRIGAGRGFEVLRDPNIRDWCRQLYEELAEERFLPVVPVDVGRYNCLIHPDGLAPLVMKSVGVATEIDRIMGFEANTTGTSYLIDPNDELGTLKIGSPLMYVTATRSKPGRLTHVKWDDEGVEPRDFAVVKNGAITNLHSNREGTGWMKGYLERTGQPMVSHGNSYALDAFDSQTIHPADLILHADPDRDTTLTQLREQLEDGVEFKTGTGMMDFQQSTGMMTGAAFKVKNGKRVARIVGGGIIFRTSELWKNLQALGGPSSVFSVGTGQAKRNPFKMSYSSVDTPPALFKDTSLINVKQKA